MGAITALARKDIRLLLRDRTGFFFTLIFPILMAVFFGAVFSGGSSGSNAISVVLVDQDETAESRSFAATLAAAPELRLDTNSQPRAAALVRAGKRVAMILLPKGFGEARGRFFHGSPPTVKIAADPSRRAEASMLKGIITRYLVSGFQSIFSDPSIGDAMLAKAQRNLDAVGEFPRAVALRRFLSELGEFNKSIPADQSAQEAWAPANVEVSELVREGKRPPNYFSISFPQGIVWGLMMCSMTFGLGMVTERTGGTLMRLRVAPISRAQILAGKAAACFALIMLLQLGLLALGTLVFGVEIGAPLSLCMAVVSAALCFVGVMMLLSVLGRTEKAASGYATAMMLVFMMVGGGMIPLFVMPSWMQTLSHASPVKWAVLALEGATWRGFGPTQMLLPCAILITVGALCFAIGTRLFRDN